MPCPFTGPKMFCAGPNFLSQPKNLTAFSASSKSFVLAQKTILLNANHLFVWHKMFWLAQYVNTLLVRQKKFGPAQNILRPVKGQGITYYVKNYFCGVFQWHKNMCSEIFYLLTSDGICESPCSRSANW